MSKNFFSFFLLLCFIGCSSNPQKNHDEVLVVDVNKKKTELKTPFIGPDQNQNNLDDLRSDKNAQNKRDNEENVKKVKLGLILGPGLYRTFEHIMLLDQIEKIGQKIDFLSGNGLGLLIAALYADGVSVSKIEWIFYRLFKQLKNIRPFSQEWVGVIKKTVNVYLKTKLIENLKIKLYAPRFIPQLKAVVYRDRGPLKQIVLENMFLDRKTMGGPNPFMLEVFNGKEFKKWGDVYLIGLDVLQNDLRFKRWGNFLIGVYGRVISNINRNLSSIDFLVKATFPKQALDEWGIYLKESGRIKEKMHEQVRVMVESFETWQKQHKGPNDNIDQE